MTQIVIDAKIVDGLFQPVCNRLAGYASCFDLSRFCADGSYVTVLIWPVGQIRDWDAALFVLPFVICYTGIFAALRYLIRFAEKRTGRGLAFGRWAFTTARIIGIAMLGQDVLLQEWDSVATMALLVAALYFASCQPAPPPERRTSAVFDAA